MTGHPPDEDTLVGGRAAPMAHHALVGSVCDSKYVGRILTLLTEVVFE